MHRPLIVANWKMHLGRTEQALGFARRILSRLRRLEHVDVVLCPPFTVLATLAEVVGPSPVALGAQTMHWAERGAHTGEISPAMLAGLCRYVILGHSERRAGAGENDAAVGRKIQAALEHSLTPILCTGEDAATRDAGGTDAFVGRQVSLALDGLDADAVRRCVIAYEPIWAIGTGRSASAADANRTIALTVRRVLAERYGEDAASDVRVLYGGSVDQANIGAFMSMPEIDGALIGGASLDEGFVELVRRAAEMAT